MSDRHDGDPPTDAVPTDVVPSGAVSSGAAPSDAAPFSSSSTDTAPGSSSSTDTAPGASAGTGVAIAGVVAGVGGLVVQLLTANTLSPQDNARFLVYWALLFGAFGLLAGVQNETTRAASASSVAPPASNRTAAGARHPRVLRVGLGVGGVMALVLAATGPWWADIVLPATSTAAAPGTPTSFAFPALPLVPVEAVAVVAAVALGTLAFSGEVATLGALAGTGRWTDYALLAGGEAVVRLLLTVGVALAGASLVGYEIAAAAAAATWLLLLLARPATRAVRTVRADRPLGPYLRSTLAAMGAAVGTSVLVTGYAVMIDLTTPPEIVEASAPFLLAVSLTRATLLMPMYALQGLVISSVVAKPQRATVLVAAAGGVILAVGLLGAGLAWLIGPWLLDLLRPGYHVEGIVLAGLMLGAICLAILVLAGAVCLALDRHRDYVLGWLIAVVVALAVLVTPLALEPRAIASLVLGPLAGAAWHLTALRVTRSARENSAPTQSST